MFDARAWVADALRTHDKRTETRREKAAFAKVRLAEGRYGVRLRKIARHVGEIVSAFPPGDPASLMKIERVLEDYAKLIEPWARVTATAMLADVSRRDEAAWRSMTKNMSVALREEIQRAPTGALLRRLEDEQVDLITSLPRKAAERVHELTIRGLVSAERFATVRAEILRTAHVTASRATLIARTETGRAATNLLEARASYVGSEGYVWRTAEDVDVRPSHKKLNGRYFRWDQPPSPDGLRGHAGTIPNCRCYAEPVLPERI